MVAGTVVHTAFHKDNPLGQWRNRIEAIYEIELPLPEKKNPLFSGAPPAMPKTKLKNQG